MWCSTELIVHCSIGTLNYSRQVSMHPGVDTCCCIMLWVKLMVIVIFGRKYFICEVDVNCNDATVNCKIVRYKLSSSKLDLFYYPMHYSILDVCNHLKLLTHVPNFSQSPLIWYKDGGSVPAIQYFSISRSVIKRILVVNWDNLWNKITRLKDSCKWQSVSLHHCKLTSLFMLWLGWTSLYDWVSYYSLQQIRNTWSTTHIDFFDW